MSMERRKRAPLATQVCDRWHLLKNLREAVEAFLIRAHIRLPQTATTPPTQERSEAASVAPTLERPLTTYSATPARASENAGSTLAQVEALSTDSRVAR
jgi:hypothetical protein